MTRVVTPAMGTKPLDVVLFPPAVPFGRLQIPAIVLIALPAPVNLFMGITVGSFLGLPAGCLPIILPPPLPVDVIAPIPGPAAMAWLFSLGACSGAPFDLLDKVTSGAADASVKPPPSGKPILGEVDLSNVPPEEKKKITEVLLGEVVIEDVNSVIEQAKGRISVAYKLKDVKILKQLEKDLREVRDKVEEAQDIFDANGGKFPDTKGLTEKALKEASLQVAAAQAAADAFNRAGEAPAPIIVTPPVITAPQTSDNRDIQELVSSLIVVGNPELTSQVQAEVARRMAIADRIFSSKEILDLGEVVLRELRLV